MIDMTPTRNAKQTLLIDMDGTRFQWSKRLNEILLV